MKNWNWLTAAGLVLTVSACGSASTDAPSSTPDTSSKPSSSAPATSTPPATTDWQRTDGVVTKISDGDTVHVTSAGRGDETVRALGADTPETHDPRRPGVQCGGLAATQFAKDTLLGQAVHLVSDPTQGALDVKTGRYVDKFHRTLAYIELVNRNEKTGAAADSDYSTLVAEAGWARAYIYDPRRPPQRIAQIQAAESRASVMRRGIWGAMCAQAQ